MAKFTSHRKGTCCGITRRRHAETTTDDDTLCTRTVRHTSSPSSPRITTAAGYHRQHKRYYSATSLSMPFIICLLLLSIANPEQYFATAGSSPPKAIPRSTNHRTTFSDPATAGDGPVPLNSPPWTPSNQIDDDGFLKCHYTLLPGEWEAEANIGGRHGPNSRRYKTLHHTPVTIRQVPGDGNCLFHSIATCLAYATNGTHVCMRDTSDLYAVSRMLRSAAVDFLAQNPHRRLFLQGGEYLRAGELVSAAAAQYDLTGEEYCEQMRRDSYWGGGPEIVALCNVLRRPIHVYELCSAAEVHPDEAEEQEGGGGGGGKKPQQLRGSSSSVITTSETFRLRRMACFGSPRYDRREPLHILSADSRFPDIQPGKHESTGNHFLAMFPDPHGEVASFVPKPARARVRGGGTGSGSGGGGDNGRFGWGGSKRWPRDENTGEPSSHKSKKRRRGKGGSGDEDDDDDGASLWEKCAKGMGRFLDWVAEVDG